MASHNIQSDQRWVLNGIFHSTFLADGEKVVGVLQVKFSEWTCMTKRLKGLIYRSRGYLFFTVMLFHPWYSIQGAILLCLRGDEHCERDMILPEHDVVKQ